jgi:putative flippase GtrA
MKLSLHRAAKFCLVGFSGAIIQSAVFYTLTRAFGVPDFVPFIRLEVPWALGWSILCAAISNYVFNELWTWRNPD